MTSNSEHSYHSAVGIAEPGVSDAVGVSAATNFSSSTGAEQCLLASLLREPGDYEDAAEHLPQGGEHFAERRHAALYDAIREYRASASSVDEPLNQVHMLRWLTAEGYTDLAGGNGYLVKLWETVPHAGDTGYYARLVRDWSVVRSYAEASERILQASTSIIEPLTQLPRLRSDAESLITSAADSGVRPVVLKNLGQAMHDRIAELIDIAADPELAKNQRFGTGIRSVDQYLVDYRPDSLVVIGADSSIGKTSLALGMAEHLGLNGHSVLYVTMEMSVRDIADRFLVGHSGVPRSKLMTPDQIEPAAWSSLDTATARLKPCPFHVYHSPGISLDELGAVVRRAKRRDNLSVVVVDYLQIMRYPVPSDEVASVQQLTSGLKTLAGQQNVAVVCLSQLRKRGPNEKADKEPTGHDLHSSGSIRRDADLVMLLHRPEYYHRDDQDWLDKHEDLKDAAYLIIDKQRNGPTRKVKIAFEPRRTKFYEWGAMGV